MKTLDPTIEFYSTIIREQSFVVVHSDCKARRRALRLLGGTGLILYHYSMKGVVAKQFAEVPRKSKQFDRGRCLLRSSSGRDAMEGEPRADPSSDDASALPRLQSTSTQMDQIFS